MLNFNKKKYVSFDNLSKFSGMIQKALSDKLKNVETNLNEKIDSRFKSLTAKEQGDSEVIDARKGEASLRAKIDVIDEDIKSVNSQLEYNEKKLKGLTSVDITEFGASESNEDNHDNILEALNYVNNNGGGIVTVPIGIFKTSPISFKGMKNITLKGQVYPRPWKKVSQLKFIENTGNDVGIQLSEQAGKGFENEVPSWSATCITIENLFLNCNKSVSIGINGNYDIILRHVVVRYAKTHGIVLEPQTYPFLIEKVESSYNGGDGIYVKSPYTTCWDIHNSEFANNEGYGVNIEGGHCCTLLSVLCQGNKRGGFRIHKKNPELYEKELYLDKLLFISCYTEENGLLDETNLNYDGNYALKVTCFDTTPKLNLNKITGLQFINCSFNASRGKGKQTLIEGVDNITNVQSNIYDSHIDFDKCGTFGVKTYIENGDFENNSIVPFMKPYNVESKKFKGYITEALIQKRGRTRVFEFKLPYQDIISGQTIKLKPIHGVEKLEGYPMLNSGSLVGVNILLPAKPKAGKVDFEIWQGYKTYGGGLSVKMSVDEEIYIDNTKCHTAIEFDTLKYPIDRQFAIGMKAKVSDDFVKYSESTFADIYCELIIEY